MKKALIKKILKMATLLKVKDIRFLRYELDKFVSMFLYFPSINLVNHPAYIYIYRELYIVKGLKANLLVSNNILAIKRVIINFANKSAIISIC